jgi:hypothetical protein
VSTFLALGAAPSAWTQAATPEQLVARALADNRAHAMLSELLAVAPKRLAGSPGMDRARAWAVATMQAVGLQKVRVEEVQVPRWVRGEVASLRASLPDGERGYDVVALGGSIGTPADGISADVLEVKSFEELRARATEAKGKIVFFNRAMPRALRNTFLAYRDAVPQRGQGAIEASKVGAVAAIVRSMTTALDDYPHTGALHYEANVGKIPAAAISTNGAQALAAALASDPSLRLTLRLDCATHEDVACGNVVGEITGAERPDEIVLCGAHLDAWDIGDGAHDDGAGVVHCLEAARLLLVHKVRPARTLRFVLFANEENGLRGGRGYAAAHEGEMARHVAAFETDSGGFEPKGFSTTLDEKARAALVSHLDPLRALGFGALIEGGGGADISVLQPFGVPLFGLVVADHRYFDFHHSARDTLDAVHERELALGAAAVAAFMAVLADPAALPEK